MGNLEPKEVTSKINMLLKFVEVDMSACQATGDILKGRVRKVKLATIGISFLITVILGITINTEALIFGINAGLFVKNAAVLLSALLTAVNTWEAFGNYQTRSTQESAMLNKLNMLFKDILLKKENCSYEEYLVFKARYDSIHEEYIQERTSSDKEESETDKKEEK